MANYSLDNFLVILLKKTKECYVFNSEVYAVFSFGVKKVKNLEWKENYLVNAGEAGFAHKKTI